ncbi:MAG: ZIP family metal transporter [Myxococcota bacterium]
MSDLLIWTLVTGVVSALATGLGAPLVFMIPKGSERISGFASAAAAGMMISASVFSLAQEGINMQGEVSYATLKVIAGMLIGTAFLWGVVERLGGDEGDGDDSAAPRLELSRRSLLLFIALFIHSAPEGIAIGVGFATGDFNFGLVMAIAISIHNVPEGIALSLGMRAEGESLLKCAAYSVLTSLPQPLLAVPAMLFFNYFKPTLPVGMGFAAGAMIYVVVIELIPDALDQTSKEATAWGVIIGLVAMLAISVLLPG